MKAKDAQKICHSLSSPSKMPCYGYSIPAKNCVTGMKLRNVEDSVCSSCYAMKGRYVFPNVQNAMEKRLSSIGNPLWVEAMTTLISEKEKSGFFRWHDSGDLQSVEHLEKIVEIAKNLPNIKFWLPTREYSFVAAYLLKHSFFPENLIVRLSALKINGSVPYAIAKRFNLTISLVSDKDNNCAAFSQDGQCLDCRNCWDKNVETVIYKKH